MSNIIDTIYNLTYKHPALPKLNFTRVTLSGRTYISPLEFLKIGIYRNSSARTLNFKLIGVYMSDYTPEHLDMKNFDFEIISITYDAIIKSFKVTEAEINNAEIKADPVNTFNVDSGDSILFALENRALINPNTQSVVIEELIADILNESFKNL